MPKIEEGGKVLSVRSAVRVTEEKIKIGVEDDDIEKIYLKAGKKLAIQDGQMTQKSTFEQISCQLSNRPCPKPEFIPGSIVTLERCLD